MKKYSPMKIGMYTIAPWQHTYSGEFYKPVYDEKLRIYAGAFYLRNCQEGWYVDFHYEIFQEEYRLMYDHFAYKYFQTKEDAIQHVNTFLTKLIKLKAFI